MAATLSQCSFATNGENGKVVSIMVYPNTSSSGFIKNIETKLKDLRIELVPGHHGAIEISNHGLARFLRLPIDNPLIQELQRSRVANTGGIKLYRNVAATLSQCSFATNGENDKVVSIMVYPNTQAPGFIENIEAKLKYLGIELVPGHHGAIEVSNHGLTRFLRLPIDNPLIQELQRSRIVNMGVLANVNNYRR